MRHFCIILFVLFLSACEGSLGNTTTTSSNSQDNSVDNSQHGITACSTGSSVVCDFEGNEWQVTQECSGPTGDPVLINGPAFFAQQPAQCEFENSTEIDVDGDGDTETVGTVDNDFQFND